MRIDNPYESPPPKGDRFTIFSADTRWWICASAGYAQDSVLAKQT